MSAKVFLKTFLEDEGNPRKRVFDAAMVALVVASIASYVVHASEGYSPEGERIAYTFDHIATGIFAAEYLARLYAATGFRADVRRLGLGGAVAAKLRVMLRPMMVIDLIALLPAARAFRIARLFRILRIFRFAGSQSTVAGFVQVFREHASELAAVFGVMAGVLLIAGIAIFLIENPREHENSQIRDLGDGLWWAIVTMTTVGYGDKVPVSTAGRVVAGFVVLSGILVIAFPTAIITSALTEKFNRLREGRVDMASLSGHIVVCGYNETALTICRELAEVGRLAGRPADIVLIASGGDDEPPEGVALKRGDVTLESTLREAGVPNAASVIVVADRRRPDQASETVDARTILTAMHVADLNPTVLIIAEIMVPENRSVLRKRVPTAECIETNALAPRLMAVATMRRGVNAVFTEILSRGGNDVYEVAVTSENVSGIPTFGAAVRELRKAPAVTLSVRRGPTVRTNPGDDYPLAAGDVLLVIAEQQPRLAVAP